MRPPTWNRPPKAYAYKFLYGKQVLIYPNGITPSSPGLARFGPTLGRNQSGSNRNAVPPKADPGRNL